MTRAPDIEATADLLHGTAIRLLRTVRSEDLKSGIPPAQLSALSVLVFAGPRTLSALAGAEQVKPPTMSQIVAALEHKGLVTRRPLDKRSAEISATLKGRRLMEAGRKRRLERLKNILAHLPKDTLAELHAAGETLARALSG